MNRSKTSVLDYSRSFWSAFLVGIGIMAAVDEVVFHQILAWHHFYDRATSEIALISDGLLHAGELVAITGGFFLLSDLRRCHALAKVYAWSGFFLGLGSFQLFDGIVDHKILRIHQIRYGVENLWLYDLIWNLSAVLLIIIGILLKQQAKKVYNVKASTKD